MDSSSDFTSEEEPETAKTWIKDFGALKKLIYDKDPTVEFYSEIGKCLYQMRPLQNILEIVYYFINFIPVSENILMYIARNGPTKSELQELLTPEVFLKFADGFLNILH